MKTTAQFWEELTERNARRERRARLIIFCGAIALAFALFYSATN